jgi:hypothetical protein
MYIVQLSRSAGCNCLAVVRGWVHRPPQQHDGCMASLGSLDGQEVAARTTRFGVCNPLTVVSTDAPSPVQHECVGSCRLNTFQEPHKPHLEKDEVCFASVAYDQSAIYRQPCLPRAYSKHTNKLYRHIWTGESPRTGPCPALCTSLQTWL